MKNKIDKLDVDKLVPFPVDLSKLKDVVKKGVVRKSEYIELVKIINNISTTDISNLVKNK